MTSIYDSVITCPACGAPVVSIKMVSTGKAILIDANSIEERVVIHNSLSLYVDTDGKESGRASLQLSGVKHVCKYSKPQPSQQSISE